MIDPGPVGSGAHAHCSTLEFQCWMVHIAGQTYYYYAAMKYHETKIKFILFPSWLKARAVIPLSCPPWRMDTVSRLVESSSNKVRVWMKSQVGEKENFCI